MINDKVMDVILSPFGKVLLEKMPSLPEKSISTEELIKKTHLSAATTYRKMSELSKWDNIGTVLTRKIGRKAKVQYYIKKPNFTITFDQNGVNIITT